MQSIKDFFWKDKFNFLLLIFLLLNFILDVINQRFWLNDFRVYYDAAHQFKTHQMLYGKSFGLGSGFYKYSPFAALVFVPLSLLDYEIAKLLFFSISSFFIFYAFTILKNWSQNYFKFEKQNTKFLIPFSAFLVCAVHLQRELHLGNLNMILVCLLLIAFEKIKNQQKIFASVIIALVIFFKPHFLILIPLLLLRKEWKFLLGVGLSMIILLLLPSLFLGWSENFTQLTAWKNAMLLHNGAQEGNEQTFLYMLHHFFQIQYSSVIWAIVVFLTAVLFSLFCLKHFANEKKNQEIKSKNFGAEFFSLISIIPNLVITDTEHFLFALPIIFGLISFLFFDKKSKLILWLAIFFLILFGIKISDVIGNNLNDAYLQNSLLGVSNFVLLLLFIFTFEKNKSQIVS